MLWIWPWVEAARSFQYGQAKRTNPVCLQPERRGSEVKVLRSCKRFESPARTPQKRGKTHGELRSNTMRAW